MYMYYLYYQDNQDNLHYYRDIKFFIITQAYSIASHFSFFGVDSRATYFELRKVSIPKVAVLSASPAILPVLAGGL